MKRKILTFALSLSFAVGASAQAVPPISPERVAGLSDSQFAPFVPRDWAILRAASQTCSLCRWRFEDRRSRKSFRNTGRAGNPYPLRHNNADAGVCARYKHPSGRVAFETGSFLSFATAIGG